MYGEPDPGQGLGPAARRATAGPTRASPATRHPLGRDFYGGDLAGITAHLDDLAARGITALYLNPIFAAPSNHRYDTSDYLTIDPDLGTQADFEALIAGAHARGIKVILDGVFNHVSSDSPWFDRYGRYAEVGACESADSPVSGVVHVPGTRPGRAVAMCALDARWRRTPTTTAGRASTPSRR